MAAGIWERTNEGLADEDLNESSIVVEKLTKFGSSVILEIVSHPYNPERFKLGDKMIKRLRMPELDFDEIFESQGTGRYVCRAEEFEDVVRDVGIETVRVINARELYKKEDYQEFNKLRP